MRKWLTLLWCVCAACAWSGENRPADNALNFRSYPQTVKITCGSAADARAAELKILPLPHPYKCALSTRWDDTNPKGHLRTLKVMKENNIRGNFFLCNVNNQPDHNNMLREILAAGDGVGVHSINHNPSDALCANQQLFQYLGNRIMLECATDRAINSCGFPFHRYKSLLDSSTRDFGLVLMTSGLFTFPDPKYKDLATHLGYPAKGMANLLLVSQGDREVDVEKAMKTFQNKAKYFSPENPALSLACHSWHTEKGIKGLSEFMKRISALPEYWHCTSEEYGAYRFEAAHCQISKKVEGDTAVFTLRRLRPIELGAVVPLSLRLTGAPNAKVEGAELKDDILTVAHAATEKTPERIGQIAADGKCAKFPGISATAVSDGKGKFAVTLKNAGAEKITAVAVTLRVTPDYPLTVVRGADAAEIAAGQDKQWTLDAGTPAADTRYQNGTPYFVSQFDFVLGGKQCRLYCENKGKQLPLPAEFTAAHAKVFMMKDGVNPADISKPEAALADLGDAQKLGNAGNASINYLPFNPQKGKEKEQYCAVYEFSANGNEVTVCTASITKAWLNGEPLKGVNDWQVKVKVKTLNGKNRLVCALKPAQRYQYYFVSVEK